MKVDDLRDRLSECAIVASVQASPNSPLESPETLLASAKASLDQGVKILRLQGLENIELIRAMTGVPTIGLLKESYSDSEVFITPTQAEVDELLETGCEVIALDGTERRRPNGERLGDIIRRIHDAGRLAMADCDTVASVHYASSCGADLIGTTLAGYTPDSIQTTSEPDLRFLRQAVRETNRPVLAEGRYSEEWHVEAALRIGALGVVIGGALNDPIKQTARYVQAASRNQERTGAVDLGGTWIRFGLFSPEGKLVEADRDPRPPSHAERLRWIADRLQKFGLDRVGVAAGGVVGPDGIVLDSKDIIPGQVGEHWQFTDVDFKALNDGLAQAWGHACHPIAAGLRVFTLALGTGVGAGFVAEQRLLVGRNGDYPRINDLLLPSGKTVEEALGGASLGSNPNELQRREALKALDFAIARIENLFVPDTVVLSGSVGLSAWVRSHIESQTLPFPVLYSPYGSNAGLYGAAHLVLNPPRGVFDR